jgi:hypothetical protein
MVNNFWLYPMIGLFAILLSTQDRKVKFAGIALPAVLLVGFTLHKPQLSLFSGWQLLNNTLYMYGHIQSDADLLQNSDNRELDRLSQTYFNASPEKLTAAIQTDKVNYFVEDPASPLNKYYGRHFSVSNDSTRVVACGKASAIFSTYAIGLIRHNPLAFSRYFLLLNAARYPIPDLAELSVYNSGEDDVSPLVQDWFDYQIPDVMAASRTLQGSLLAIYPYLFLFAHITFIGSAGWWWLKRKNGLSDVISQKTILLMAVLLIANFVFSLWTCLIVMRSQIFSLISSVISSLLVIDLIEKTEVIATKKNSFHENRALTIDFNN